MKPKTTVKYVENNIFTINDDNRILTDDCPAWIGSDCVSDMLRTYNAKRVSLFVLKFTKLLKTLKICKTEIPYSYNQFFDQEVTLTTGKDFSDYTPIPLLKPKPAIRNPTKAFKPLQEFTPEDVRNLGFWNCSSFQERPSKAFKKNFHTGTQKYGELSSKDPPECLLSYRNKKPQFLHPVKEYKSIPTNAISKKEFGSLGKCLWPLSKDACRLSDNVTFNKSVLKKCERKKSFLRDSNIPSANSRLLNTETRDCSCLDKSAKEDSISVRIPPKRPPSVLDNPQCETTITLPIGKKVNLTAVNSNGKGEKRRKSLFIRIENIPEDIDVIKINSDLMDVRPQITKESSRSPMYSNEVENLQPKSWPNKAISSYWLTKKNEKVVPAKSKSRLNYSKRCKLWGDLPTNKTDILERVLAFKETVKEFRESKEELERQIYIRSGQGGRFI